MPLRMNRLSERTARRLQRSASYTVQPLVSASVRPSVPLAASEGPGTARSSFLAAPKYFLQIPTEIQPNYFRGPGFACLERGQ